MSRVVIVDDQAVNRKVLSKLAGTLEANVEVVAFADPLLALSFARHNTLDLLITDYRMPKINGAEMIRRFRALPDCSDVPALVVTAYEDMEYRARAMEAGANDFILSPLNHVEFRLQSSRLLAMYRESRVALFHSPEPEVGAVQVSAKPPGQIEMFNNLLEDVATKLLHKTSELQRVSAELQNLLEINETPTIVVDRNLHVRRYTPQIAAVFAPDETKVGVRLTAVPCKLRYGELASDFRKLVQGGQIIERYLEHKTNNSRYLLRMIPNHYGDDSPPGATLIFNDVTAWSSVRPGVQFVH